MPVVNIDEHINVLDNPHVGYVCAKKAMSERKAKKRHFSDCEIETIMGEIEARKNLYLVAMVLALQIFFFWVATCRGNPGQKLGEINMRMLASLGCEHGRSDRREGRDGTNIQWRDKSNIIA